MITLTVSVKVIDKKEHHYQVSVPFCTGTLSFDYYNDLFGVDYYQHFVKMVKNYVKPDKIEVLPAQ